MHAAYQAGAASRDTQHVGGTQEIWDAINVDLQQILDDVSCWEGKGPERMCERLETAIKRLNAAVGHEREGYETAIATSYDNDRLRAEAARYKAMAYDEKSKADMHYENAAAARDEIEALRADAESRRKHVKPKIVGWMNPCNGIVIDIHRKHSLGVGRGYPNFSVPVYAAIAAEATK